MGDSRRKPLLLVGVTAAALWAGGASLGFAGSGNVLYLLQDSGSYPVGESFQSDQSSSINSSIGSLDQEAFQGGSGDTATLSINSSCAHVSASCGHADLTQEDDYVSALQGHPLAQHYVGLISGAVGPNSATISVTGQGSAAISQYGFGNEADIAVDGTGVTKGSAGASITQVGLNNQASLEVSLSGQSRRDTEVSVKQFGVGNIVDADVTAAAGTKVSYTQLGGGLSYGTPASPVTIATTRSVSVVQTNIGTFGHLH